MFIFSAIYLAVLFKIFFCHRTTAYDGGEEQQDRRVSGVSSASSETTLVEGGEEEAEDVLGSSDKIDLSADMARIDLSVVS